MGHARVYTISDAFARYFRLKGRVVRHPIGWDAFGLPAENASRNAGVQPRTFINAAIQRMSRQLHALHMSFDWSVHDTFATSDAAYFTHTQRLFLALLERGMAYRAAATVWWDPTDATTLADEQVDADGRSWRSGALVERRILSQWFVRTTALADALLADEAAGRLDGWPCEVRDVQRAWIGRRSLPLPIKVPSAAYLNVEYCVEGAKSVRVTAGGTVRALYTGSQTFNGSEEAKGRLLKDACLVETLRIHQIGCELAIFAPKEECDFWHTVRQTAANSQTASFTVHLFAVDDETQSLFQPKTADETPQIVTYKMRDWLVSRQRAWGTPVPVIHCEACGVVPLLVEHLPVHPPASPPPSSASASSDAAAWRRVTCHRCGRSDAVRDSDTLDTFVDSSWYWARFLDVQRSDALFSPALLRPVDVYVGGVEHAKTHLLYARLIHRFLRQEAPPNAAAQCPVPFRHVVAQGVVCAATHRHTSTGRYLHPDEAAAISPTEISVTWEKMSKSKHNGVDVSGLVEAHGADVVRLALLFATTPEATIRWDEALLVGPRRWIARLFALFGVSSEMAAASTNNGSLAVDAVTEREIRRTVATCTAAFEAPDHAFNKAIASLMNLSNVLTAAVAQNKTIAATAAFRAVLRKFAVMLLPFAPCTAAELYAMLSSDVEAPNDIWNARWPTLKAPFIPASNGGDAAFCAIRVFSDGRYVASLPVPRKHAADRAFVEAQLRDAFPALFSTEIATHCVFKPAHSIAIVKQQQTPAASLIAAKK